MFPYNEDPTNTKIFVNLLRQIRDLVLEQKRAMMSGQQKEKETVQQKIMQLKKVNESVYRHLSNPYLRLFFFVMFESKR